MLAPLLLFFASVGARRLAQLSPTSLPLQLLPRATTTSNDSTVSGITGVYPSTNAYYTVVSIGGYYLRVALDTASADLWVVGSSCKSSSCASLPSYPLDHQSPTFGAVNNSETVFKAGYADGTAASGFVALETIQVANITLPGQTFAVVTDMDLTMVDEMSGVLGLGFPRLSSIARSVPGSQPFFVSLAQKGLLDYPLFALNLAGGESGSLTLGAIDADVVKDVSQIAWNPVVEFSPFGTESNSSSYLQWALPMDRFAVDTSTITPTPTYPHNTGNTSLAMFDVGLSGITGPFQDVERIFAKIDGSRLVSEDGLWAVPCDTTVPMSFTFGNKTYTLQPTDYLIGRASGNPAICLSWPKAAQPSADGIDWQFGIPFLRTVYSVFAYGINTKEAPHIGFYPLRNATEPMTAANVSSYLSAMSATVATTLPNSLLDTPAVSTPVYTFNTSVGAPTGGIVSSALATSTYSAILGTKKAVSVTSLPQVSFSPTLSVMTTTDASGSVVVSTSTVTPTYVLGFPNRGSGSRLCAAPLHILSLFTLLLVVF